MSPAPDRPPSLLALPAYLLSLTGRQTRAAIADGLAAVDLRLDQLAALAALSDFGVQAQRELGARLRKDAGDVVRLVDDLEQHGWAARERDPGDRRRSLVSLTDAGRRALSRGLEAARAAEAAALSPLDPAERDALRDLLQRVQAAQCS